MPIESLKLKKAPAKWAPDKDQAAMIQQDPRLQRMTRDDLYFFFNQPKTPATKVPAKGATPAPRQQPAQGGAFGWIDSIITAMRGGG
jgi:hypothetical protein